MRRVDVILLVLIALVGSTDWNISLNRPVFGQELMEVKALCSPTWQSGLPETFQGAIYRVRTPNEGYEVYQLEKTTSAGMTLIDIAMPPELFGDVFPSEISPDGQYILFLPTAESTPLAVWSVSMNQFVIYNLSLEEAAYLYAESTPIWRQLRKVDWISSDQFVVRHFDLDNEFFLDVLSEQRFTVIESPLQIVADPIETTVYPPLEFPTQARLNTKSLSPQKTYTELLFNQVIRGSGQVLLRFEIYLTETMQMVAAFTSDAANVLVSQPLWTADEQILFLEYKQNNRWRMSEVNVSGGFIETHTLSTLLLQQFGEIVDGGRLHEEIDEHFQRLIFTFDTQSNTPYIGSYNYGTGDVTAICRESAANLATINPSIAYIAMSADEEFIGYYDNGFLHFFSTVSGERYISDGLGFVGWLDH